MFNAAEMPKYAEKICDMRTLLKYAKIRRSANMRKSHIRVFLTLTILIIIQRIVDKGVVTSQLSRLVKP